MINISNEKVLIFSLHSNLLKLFFITLKGSDSCEEKELEKGRTIKSYFLKR